MMKSEYQKIQSLLAILSFFVLFASFYFQYMVGLQPCPLCLMQRVCVFVLLCLAGLRLSEVKSAHRVSVLQIFFAAAGLFFSLRHLWLQSLPIGQAPACMPGLDILIHYFPWKTILQTLLWGAGDCAESSWSMLGISMPGWSAMYFLFMLLASIFLYFRTRSPI